MVAKCFTPDGSNVGQRLVAAGWALAYRRYSTDYVAAETAARQAGRGIWRGRFVKPWDWRLAQAQAAAPVGPRSPARSPRD